ncbi:cytochrome C oxidase subunit IV family protein [Microaerobacter geothermalis]|uniref:cytochrome o ubiquinol oxidase subunit IV n=1 Tax=Microaerobacter geothermalis TaxID=674972 RepID=UPI001F23BE26|nr:cytochrome C oxidase subunit IV family protein [Microaerobacter geothermalis]MCF6093035.1 cytochrome C oxidase subunit IV family protein [Microaerobacter geothermalis]
MVSNQQHHDSSAKTYILGYTYSLILTIVPLILVLNDLIEKVYVIVFILIAACLQFLVQIYYFMHVRETKNRGYILLTLAVGIVMVITVVGGSAWVMSF